MVTVAYASISSPALEWQLLFVRLPDGMNKVTIKGTRDPEYASGFALDDIAIGPCEQIGS